MEKVALLYHPDEYFRIVVSSILKQNFGFTKVDDRSVRRDIRAQMNINANKFDLVIIDADMISADLIRKTWAETPSIKFLVVAEKGTEEEAALFLNAQAKAYFSKKETVRSLIATIGVVLKGGIQKSYNLQKMADDDDKESSANSEDILSQYDLPSRQIDVWRLLTLGKPTKLIARDLDISEGTVKIHLKALYKNLGVANGKAAAALGAAVFK